MLTGRVPFPADSHDAVIAKHLTEEASSVRDLDPEISPDTAALVARLLQKAPDARIGSATELGQALDAAQKQLKVLRARNEPPAAPAVSSGGAPTVRRRRRRR